MGGVLLGILLVQTATAQQNYFIDGYHGGFYGHYPDDYTAFINEQLQAHPAWKINLELEPVTWDAVQRREPEAYAVFKQTMSREAANGRIEYVNPSYGQSYLYTGSGESMIRQFSYGMQKIKAHFPEATFTTYSSEEPCFTSALPQVLLSFGIHYAALKNPNTCWGGYTRAFGGELVQWQGPDGSQVLTVPRYSSEQLEKKSTWQTTAWNNNVGYIQSALAAGIAHPVGMCLQDAGWRNGPWLKDHAQYVTWREYIGHVADHRKATVWKLSQEDVLVSLVWGAQALQRIAQQVRAAENNIVAAEKYAAMRTLLEQQAWPQYALDSAWKNLLLSQHHDCWIVPYNGRPGDTWIDKVQAWTDNTRAVSHDILQPPPLVAGQQIRLVNTTVLRRDEWVTIPYSSRTTLVVTDAQGKPIPSSRSTDTTLVFHAQVPPMGFTTYRLVEGQPLGNTAHLSSRLPDGKYNIHTDLYQVVIDPAKGGIITSLVDKRAGSKELVDAASSRGFNEMRGYFYHDSAWHSSMDTAATVTVLEDGVGKTTVQVKGFIGPHPFTQLITLASGQPRIDLQVTIDWQGNPGIGAYSQDKGYQAESPQKAFYNDSCKLLVLFPANLQQQQVHKDAPYDVTTSRLSNTFFNRWDSIKNNVLLHWVDVTDGAGREGLAVFSDHTTSYVHGEHYPLGFTLQYSGRALWGRNYTITGPTTVHYALLPHQGNWEQGGVAAEETKWCAPLQVVPGDSKATFSLFSVTDTRWQSPAVMIDGKDLLIRLYNAAGDDRPQEIRLNGKATQALLEQLDGRLLQSLKITNITNGGCVVKVAMPRFGIRTLRFKNVTINR
ncbi:alpha-mannosidase [Chitinophaga costaii]|uniref:Alpha-mannosidase n=2 Tax=Chitinophaga costaii TaxID=1335309 RepID=A0A1C4AVJ9_9BACT|nr:alpha-mannosidase [Chitinophaga costaii]